MAVVLLLGESFDGRAVAVIAQNSKQSVSESRFSVRTYPIAKEKNMLPSLAGKTVASESLQIRAQLSIFAGDALQEFTPQRTISGRHTSRELGDIVLRPMGAKFAGLQFNRPPLRVKKPKIGIELLRDRHQSWIRPAYTFNCGNCFRRPQRLLACF